MIGRVVSAIFAYAVIGITPIMAIKKICILIALLPYGIPVRKEDNMY